MSNSLFAIAACRPRAAQHCPTRSTARHGRSFPGAGILLAVVAAICCPLPVSGQQGGPAEPTYFRSRHGVALGPQRYPSDLEKDASLVWKTPLLAGNSTPAVAGQRVFVSTFDSETQKLAVTALDRKTGKVVWKKDAPADELEPYHPVGSPASASPACDDQHVYAFFGSSGLWCWDHAGNFKWFASLGPFQDEFGASSSPVLVDDKIILNEDHDVGSFLVALDKQTGKILWKQLRPEATRSYATPVVHRTAAGTQILVAGALRLTAYDVATGKPVWWVRGLSRIVDSTPIIQGDWVYLATWTPGGDTTERISMEPFPEALKQYDRNGDQKIGKQELPEGPVLTRFFRIDLNQDEMLDKQEWNKHAAVFEQAQNAAMAIQLGGKGDVTDTHVRWIHRRGLPTVPSSVVYQNVMYMVKDSGIITSLDAETGEVLEQGRAPGRGNYYASLVAGDGKVYLASERGVLTVLAAGRKWKVLSSHDFGERIMATPVLAQGQLLIRTDKALYCYTCAK